MVSEAEASLHRYFIWANRVRIEFDAHLKNSPPPIDPFLFFADHSGIFMALWYAALFVVVEGWNELKLSDPEIDGLLSSPNVALLRRFRNGVSHFQPHWLDSRLAEFCASPDSVAWVRSLHAAFSRYFLAMYPPKPLNQ